ncbi:MAG: hypothetical protein PHD82_09880 [Candidatus Riflebacteria bacterium]|nr:hypothetical protein [Candidatus Riflebacteria bacterium]
MKTTRGSAMLMVLGTISVLLIISFSLLSSKTERAYSTRSMSNEKKAEALAESAADLMIAYVRKIANKHAYDGDSSALYHLFRTPLKLSLNKLATNDGRNIPCKLDDLAPTPVVDSGFGPLAPLVYMIDELGGPTHVKLEVLCSIVQAEGFAAHKGVSGDYDIVGITEQSVAAKGVSASFLDSIDDGADSDGSLTGSPWAPSDWELDINLPNLSTTDTKKFDVDTWLGDVEVTLKLTKETKTKIKIEAKALGIGVYEKTIECNDYVQDYLPDIVPLNMHGARKKFMPGSDSAMSNEYKAQRYSTLAKDEFNKAKAAIDEAKLDKTSFGSEPRIVEKGGIFQIEAKVEFFPNGPNGKKIDRHLVAQTPFKVSDVQPIAPEYSFFVANSPLIKENSPRPGADGNPIDLNVANPPGPGPAPIPAAPVGYFTVHNVPSAGSGAALEANFKNITGFTSNTNDKALIPGMVRINANAKMKLHSFIGTFAENFLTEFNTIFSPFSASNPNLNKFQTKPTFQWYGESMSRMHEVEFPVLFDDITQYTPVPEKGCTGIMKIYEEGGLSLMMVPTLLHGHGHFEYPLGIRPEGPIDMVYGRIKVQADPKAKVSFATTVKDKTEIYIYYDNFSEYSSDSGGGPAKYGMQQYPAYDSDGEWNPISNFKLMPANCYSILQYSKKASRFYASQSEFKSDLGKNVDAGGLKNPDGSIDINGVIYVKGSLTIDSPLNVKGKGLLVAKTDITLTANVTRADDKTVFGLIARGGQMNFNGCSKVEAACFSNDAPITTSPSPVIIDGNLVSNGFDRRKIIDLKVFYNSRACSVNPLATMRDVGKYAPERYFVSFADNWSKFTYEKK